MKGPGLRNELDVRRVWRCPQCGAETRHLGDIVSLGCPCTSPPTWMQVSNAPKRELPKFEKVVIPLRDEDLVIRDRPRRIPAFLLPPEPGTEGADDPRQHRGRRPRPPRPWDNAEQRQNAPAEPPPPAPTAEAPPAPPPQAPAPAPPAEDDFAAGLE